MDMLTDESGNSTLHFIQTILIALCSNFNPNNIPDGDWECRFRPEYYYQLKTLKGKTLKFTTLQKPPLSGTEIGVNGEVRGTGIAFDIIHEIQQRFGFYYNITLPNENSLGNEKFGIMKLLYNQEVDMAVVFIPMTEEYRKFVAFSSVLAEFEWVLMMARPSASASGSGLLAPFQRTVWLFILMSLIIAGPTMYLIVYLRSKMSSSIIESRKQYTLLSCIWFVYGALMKQGSTLNPVSDSPRLFFATWWIFITILTSFYTANLTAFLTLSEFTLTIQTPKDIYDHKRHWMADKGGYTEALVNQEDIFRQLRQAISNQDNLINGKITEKLHRISKGSVYISEKRKAQQYMLRDYMHKAENHVPEKKRCTYVLTPKTILTKTVAFGYARNSTLRALLDPLLTYFVHGGIIGHLLDENLPLTTICPLNLATRERKLKNSDLLTMYKVVAVGFGCSFVAFIGEIINKILKKNLMQKKLNTVKLCERNNISNFSFLNKESKVKDPQNDNLFISQYYKEIMMPYDISLYNMNNFTFVQERYPRRLIPNNQPTNFLFQYTN